MYVPKPSPTARQVGWSALCILGLTIYGSLLPFSYTSISFNEALTSFRQISFLPARLLEARGDWAISIAQFSILTFLSIGALSVDRPGWLSLVWTVVVVIACVALAISVEFLQIFFPPRTVSINDIYVESLGGLIGAAAWLFTGQRIIDWLRRLGTVSNLATLARRLLPGYVVAVLILQLMPFDFVINRAELMAKFHEGKIHWIPFRVQWEWTKLPLILACFFPLGLLQTFASKLNRRHQWPLFWLALAFPVIVEGLQLFVYSRVFDSADMIAGILSVILGAWTARLLTRTIGSFSFDRRNDSSISIAFTSIWLLMLLVWIFLVTVLNWSPFNFTTDATRFVGDSEELSQHGIRRMAIAPFVDYYCGSKYNALDQFVRKSLSFLPLGILLAFTSNKRDAPNGHLKVWVTSLTAALVIEAGRYFLPNRTPSVTDALVSSMGALAGFCFAQFLMRVTWAEVARNG